MPSMARRSTQPMPDDVREEIEERRLLDDYAARPFYQRNDYLAWIGRARQAETRTRRIEQMVRELEMGGTYMGMPHPPSRKE